MQRIEHADLEGIMEGADAEMAGAPSTEVQVGSESSLKWGQLQDEIIDALIQDEHKWDGPRVNSLAIHMRSSVDELQSIIEASNPEEVQTAIDKKLLEQLRIQKTGYNWDRLEAAVLHKLGTLVETNRVIAPEALLAIAKAANSATRRGTGAGAIPMGHNPHGGPQINIQLNQNGEPGLPGKGPIGTINLTLNQRTVSQLSQQKTIDLNAEKLSEKIQMLTPDDVKELNRKELGV